MENWFVNGNNHLLLLLLEFGIQFQLTLFVRSVESCFKLEGTEILLIFWWIFVDISIKEMLGALKSICKYIIFQFDLNCFYGNWFAIYWGFSMLCALFHVRKIFDELLLLWFWSERWTRIWISWETVQGLFFFFNSAFDCENKLDSFGTL